MARPKINGRDKVMMELRQRAHDLAQEAMRKAVEAVKKNAKD